MVFSQPRPVESKYIVQNICTNLSFMEMMKLSAVCKSWQQFLGDLRFHPRPPSIDAADDWRFVFEEWPSQFPFQVHGLDEMSEKRKELLLNCVQRIEFDLCDVF